MSWGTIVGDDREIAAAFRLSGERADAVIVNGGLGRPSTTCRRRSPPAPPGSTRLNEDWLRTWNSSAAQPRLSANNRSRRCCRRPPRSSTTDRHRLRLRSIGRARFFRPACRAGFAACWRTNYRACWRAARLDAIHLKRFHSYGLGESHVDQLLTGVEDFVPDGSVETQVPDTTRRSRPS